MKEIMKNLLFGFVLLCWMVPSLSLAERPEERKRADGLLAAAKTPEEKGMAISLEMDFRLDGIGDWSVDEVLVITNARGEEKRREFRLKVLGVPGEGDKFLAIFDKPADVKGVAQLIISHKDKVDESWVYVPALRRVKRISSQNKGGSFLGSEFINEDLIRGEAEKYKYKWLRDEVYEDEMCYVIERYPDLEYSNYSKWVSWIDHSEFRVRKTEYYDKKGLLVKTIKSIGYKLYLDDFWFVDEYKIVNHQTGKSSSFLYEKYYFRTGLKDRDFSVNALKRMR
jgi:hypothetical protein